MRRVFSMVCIIALALCLCAPAGAADSEYLLPDGLKTVAASADKLGLPEGLPEHAHVVSYSVENGLIHIQLDREVPSLKIKELNFNTGEESTIFSWAKAESAEAHRYGDANSVFTMLLTWKVDRLKYTEEFTTWSGDMVFSRAGVTEKANDEFPDWNSAERRIAFSEDRVLLSETWTLTGKDQLLTRTANYDSNGQLTSCQTSWQAAGYTGYSLDVETAPDGNVLGINCYTENAVFSVESLPVTAEPQQLQALRDNSYDPGEFEAAFRAAYPRLAGEIYGTAAQPVLPATMTDLPATMTDLPATATDLKKEPVPEGETTENTRIWLISYGDYFEYSIYVFASDDPLFIIQDGKAVPNPDAKDINGTPISYKEMKTTATPVFEAPVIE